MKQVLKIVGWVALGIVAILAIVALFVVLPIQPKANEAAKLGVTFSIRAAEYLELDWKAAFNATIDELDPDIIRIPVYWDRVEPRQGQFVWDEIDYQMDQLKGKDTQVILVIGHKLPRWPECHVPEWFHDFSNSEKEDALSTMIGEAVDRYKDNKNLYAWQIENESLFPFGECTKWTSNRPRLKRLINIVQQRDSNHKIITTDSGELSLWLRTATLPIDALGISLYRVAYNEKSGYVYWPVNPYYYKIHSWLVKPFIDEIIITELQMEPWAPAGIENLSDGEIYRSFSPYDFRERIDFAQRIGSTIILAWGVEWWYYMDKVRGNGEYWDRAVEVFDHKD